MEVIKEVTVGTKRVKIFTDESPESPRTWDNLGKMICSHRRYDLGDKHNYNPNNYNSLEEVTEAIRKGENAVVMLPLFLYDHSGITISTSTEYPFNDRWDAGQVGFIIVTREAMLKEYGIKRITKKHIEQATKVLKSEVKVYDQYLTGEVYGFKAFEVSTCDKGCEHEEETDSCWGFFGDDFKTNGISDYLEKELAEALINN
jgi:hypothetical protein